VYQLELALQAFILETNIRIGLQAIENNDNKPSGDSNCTPLSEDSTCPSVTITSMELKHSPTHKEQTKETTTTNEWEIILKTETRPGPETTKNNLKDTKHLGAPTCTPATIMASETEQILTTLEAKTQQSEVKGTENTGTKLSGKPTCPSSIISTKAKYNRRKKAAPRSTKTSPRDKNRKTTKTTLKENGTKTSDKDSDTKDSNPKYLTTEIREPKITLMEKTLTIQTKEVISPAVIQASIESVNTSPNMDKTSTIQIEEQFNEERTRAKMASPQEISAMATTHRDNGNTDENDNKDASHLHNKFSSMLNEDEILAAVLKASIGETYTTTTEENQMMTLAIEASLGDVTKKQQEAEIMESKITHTEKTSTIQIKKQFDEEMTRAKATSLQEIIEEQFNEEMTRTKTASLQEISAIPTTRKGNGNLGENDNSIVQDKDDPHPHNKILPTLNEEEILAVAIQASIDEMNTIPNTEDKMMELAIVVSIQEGGIPITPDENLNAICPNIYMDVSRSNINFYTFQH
jgi:hypothetical protein